MYLHLQILLIIYGATVNGLDNGARAKVGEFKFIVSIWEQDTPLCAGTIIHKRHVLTAAHCVVQEPPFTLVVYAGVVDLPTPNLIGENVRSIHPYYGTQTVITNKTNALYFKDDIVILEIVNEFSWSSIIAPIPIPTVEYWNPCETCIVPKWNMKKIDNTFRLILISTYGYVFSEDRCRRTVKDKFSNEKCAHDDYGRAIAVHGDSGAPFVCGGVIAGIIVRGYTDVMKPTIILSTYPYKEYIYQTIHDDTEDVHPEQFPYVVSIWSSNVFICGGTIIDQLHIITMAHCVKNLIRTTLKVIVGRNVLVEQYAPRYGSAVDSVDLYLHYEKQFLAFSQYNIAVLKLAHPLIWSSIVMGVSSSIEVDPLPGQYCEVLRWNRRNEWWGDITWKLVWARAVILTAQMCKESGIVLGSNQFCATSVAPFPLAFKEDSGNPIVCGGNVVGIIAKVPQTFSLFQSSTVTFIRLSSYINPIKFAARSN